MFQVPLSPLPNQTIAFNVDGAYWQIHVYQAISQVYADISRNGTILISGVRCFNGIGLLPYKHLYLPNFGNFIFDSDVDWTNFGSSCSLYYLTNTEYATFQSLMAAGE